MVGRCDLSAFPAAQNLKGLSSKTASFLGKTTALLRTALQGRLIVVGGCRLSRDVSSWLDQGSYKGEMKEVVWDEDGEMLKLPTRPATWTAPDTNSTSHR